MNMKESGGIKIRSRLSLMKSRHKEDLPIRPRLPQRILDIDLAACYDPVLGQ